MTVNRGPGVAPIAGVGTTTVEHRLQLAGLYAENAPGVPRSGVLAQANATLVTPRSDMSWDVSPMAAVISRTAGEGVYTPTLTGTTNVPTDPAPGSNSRWDLLYFKQNDQAKGDPDNAAVIDVIKGTALASPSKPYGSVPDGGLVLAEARIFAGTTGTNGGSNTTAQVWLHTATRGAPIPVRNTTERGALTVFDGLQVERLDLPGVPTETRAGGAWRLDYADTGWINVPLQNGFTHYTAGSNWLGLRYRVKDGIVYVNGAAGNPNAWVVNTVCGAIPSTYWPSGRVQGINVQVDPTAGYLILSVAGGAGAAATLNATYPVA